MKEQITIRGWVLAIPVLVVVLTLEAVLFDQRVREASASIQKTLPVLGDVRPFELVDASGLVVSEQSLKGHIWILHLAHTKSQVQTPLLMQTMQELQRLVPSNWPVHFLSVAVDPHDDTPENLTALLKNANAEPTRWTAYTGRPDILREFVFRSLRLGMDRHAEDADDPIGHSARLVLIDEQGRVRAYYDGTAENPYPDILADLQLLVSNHAG